MHLILTGATGLVGSGVLDTMLATPEISRLSILSRHPVPLLEDRIKAGDPTSNPDRVRVILHCDFSLYDESLLKQLSDACGIVWALGISQTQVRKEEYYKITHDYPLAFARAFKKLHPPNEKPESPFRFVYVSGEGATTSPGRLTALFGRVKGETEIDLIAESESSPSHLSAISVRPAGVDQNGHSAIIPYLPPASVPISIMRSTLLPLLRTLYPAAISPTRPLGQFLTDVAMGRYDEQLTGPGIELFGSLESPIVSNFAFRRLAGLSTT